VFLDIFRVTKYSAAQSVPLFLNDIPLTVRYSRLQEEERKGKKQHRGIRVKFAV